MFRIMWKTFVENRKMWQKMKNFCRTLKRQNGIIGFFLENERFFQENERQD